MPRSWIRICCFVFQTRTVQCMVILGNSSQNVDSALCEDAGLRMPESVQKCGAIDCPKWVAGEWSPCNATSSKCFSWHTAIQRRRVTCEISGIKTSASKCSSAERPVSKQECYSEECRGVWKVDPWSEVSFILKSHYLWNQQKMLFSKFLMRIIPMWNFFWLTSPKIYFLGLFFN